MEKLLIDNKQKQWTSLWNNRKRVCRNKQNIENSLIYRIVSNKRPGGVAIFQKGDVYKRQVFNAKMQCLSLFTMTRRREI